MVALAGERAFRSEMMSLRADDLSSARCVKAKPLNPPLSFPEEFGFKFALVRNAVQNI